MFSFLEIALGESCLSDILQCKIDYLFHDLETAPGIADDMTAWSYEADGSDHDRCAEQTLKYVTGRISISTQKGVSWGVNICLYVVL